MSLGSPPLKLIPASPARCSEGTLRHGCDADNVRARGRDGSRWTSVHGRWGSGPSPPKLNFTLPGQGVPATTFVDFPVLPFHSRTFLPTPPMRDTQRLAFLVPVADNSGQPFLDSLFADLEELLVSVAGGFTRRSDVTGAWRAPNGEIYRDTSRDYTVTVPTDDAASVATSINRFVRTAFRQLAVLIEATPTTSAAF